MAQEDYLKSQFDKLGSVLAKMLSMALGLKYDQNSTIPAQNLEHSFSSELNLDIQYLIANEPAEVLKELIHERKYSPDHLKSLADVLYYYGRNDSPNTEKIRKLTLDIYSYLQSIPSTKAYLDIPSRIREIKFLKSFTTT